MLNNSISRRRFSKGVTLLEALISLTIGLFVTGAMVTLMGNSMGSTTRIIEMSQLTDELRNTMHLITRDIRRANYTPLSHLCYGNSDCNTDGTVTSHGDIVINGSNNCVTYDLDRDWGDDGASTNNNAGGFRMFTDGVSGIRSIEMWVGGASPNCAATSNDWVPITDPGFVDITNFTVTNNLVDSTITQEGGGTFTQRGRRINIIVAGQLIIDNNITRRVVDEIKVRNDYFF